MSTKKRILLKLTGELLLSPDKKSLDASCVKAVIAQIKALSDSHQFGIVLGGGNFFRGSAQGTALGINPSVGHHVGMLATMMNGLLVKDLFEQQGFAVALFSALSCPEIGLPTSQQSIDFALQREQILLFAGGTGNPFFTTDTNAVLRSLQMQTAHIWKGTNVDGVYDSDPRTNPAAKLLKQVSYADALQQKLGIMDLAAFAMAQQYGQEIRVFNIFNPDALIGVANDTTIGSVIR